MKTIEPASKQYRNNVSAAKNLFEKDQNETNEQKNKQVEFIKKAEEMHLKNAAEYQVKNTEDSPTKCEDSERIIQNGSKAESVTPPKPLPRRTNSLTETEDVTVQKPVARPRTNSVITTTASLSIAVATPSSTNTSTTPPASHSPPTTYKVCPLHQAWLSSIVVVCV